MIYRLVYSFCINLPYIWYRDNERHKQARMSTNKPKQAWPAGATRTAVAGALAATAEAAVARAAAGVGVLHVLPPRLFFLSFFLFSFLLFIFISSIYIIVVFTLFYFIKLFDTAWNMAK